MKLRIPILALLFAVATGPLAHADEIAELVERADMAWRGDTSAGVFEMEIKTSSYERSYKVVMWDDRRGDRERTLVKILGPALWRGFGTLKVGGQLKLYDPKTNHVTVVSHSMLGDSWMGSHFTNDDLVKETQLAKHYEVKLLKKWTAESALGSDSTFYRVRLRPKPSAPVAWDRIVYTVVVRGDDALPTKAEYYRKAKQKKPSRTMTFSDFDDLGGRTLAKIMKVTVANKPGEHTLIRYTKLKFDVKISKSKFTEQALKK
jgi:outer membrane lipoprotein-sorting protein